MNIKKEHDDLKEYYIKHCNELIKNNELKNMNDEIMQYTNLLMQKNNKRFYFLYLLI
jgi:hypothetical protein